MDDEMKQKLETLAEKRNAPFDDVKEVFQTKQAEVKANLGESVDDSRVDGIAYQATHGEFMQDRRVAGEVEELPTIVIGHGGERHIGNNDQGVVGYGIVNPQQPGEVNEPPEEDPPGLAVFVFNEADGCDLGMVRQKFSRYNTVKVWATRRQSSDFPTKGRHVESLGSKPPVYRCESTGETRIEEEEFDDLPSEEPEIRDLINRNYITDEDAFTLANHAEHLSAMQGGYTAEWGADLKRFEGRVVDYMRMPDKDFGKFTMVDDSIMDIEELEDTDLDLGIQGSPMGLQVFMPPEMVQFDTDSIIEVYGTLTRTQDGEIVMNGCSAVPVAAYELDESEMGSSGGSNVESESI